MAKTDTGKLELDIKDYIKDTRLLELNERGGWIELILYMSSHEPKGEISGTYPFFAKVMSCEEKEAKSVIKRLIDEKICNYEPLDDDKIKIISRRMKRKIKKAAKQGEPEEVKEQTIHVRCREFFIQTVRDKELECNWNGRYAKALKLMLEKIKNTLIKYGREVTDDAIFTGFEYMINNLPEFYHKSFDLSTISSKYDSILNQLKQPKKSKGHDNINPEDTPNFSQLNS